MRLRSDGRPPGFRVPAHLTARAAKRGKASRGRRQQGGAQTASVPLVPALRLTTTIDKRLRWLVVPSSTATWAVVWTDAQILYGLAARVNSTTIQPLFTAFRLKKVSMYVVPQAGTAIDPRTVPQIAWATATTTTGIDAKPDDIVPAITDTAHTTAIHLTPNKQSLVAFWSDEVNSEPYFVVYGPTTAGSPFSIIVDVDFEATLPDSENIPSTATVGSITTGWAQRAITGTNSSFATPLGYPSYAP